MYLVRKTIKKSAKGGFGNKIFYLNNMKVEQWIAIGGFVTICASALALVIKQLEASRCSKIKMCGCIDCDRVPPETENNNVNNEENNP